VDVPDGGRHRRHRQLPPVFLKRPRAEHWVPRPQNWRCYSAHSRS
jgi:hypothetical protein